MVKEKLFTYLTTCAVSSGPLAILFNKYSISGIFSLFFLTALIGIVFLLVGSQYDQS